MHNRWIIERLDLAPPDSGMPNDTDPCVLIAEPLDQECVAWLASRARVVLSRPGQPDFAPTLARADALIVRTYVRVDAALLAIAPQLRVVGRAGVGLDNIDLPACAARGIQVVSTPLANIQAVVEFVLAEIFDDLRPRPRLTAALAHAPWEAHRLAHLADRQLSELTLAILGFGRIGSELARVARALGMRTVYHDLCEIPESKRHGATPLPPPQLFTQADILSIHVDGTPSNRGLIGGPALAALKPDVLLINTSRGFVLDNAALTAWLAASPRARAVLDVHEPEPFGPDYPLLALPNARLTAHIASGTRTAKRNMSWVVKDVWNALAP